MKKSTISLSLLLLVGASCLTACNKASVKPKFENGKAILFEFNGEKYTADDLLSNDELKYTFLSSEEGAKQLFNELEKTIIKGEVDVTDNIKNAVDIKMDDWKEEVKTYAKENGLTDRLAERALLEQKGFETRDELRESYIYEEQKSQFIKDFQAKNMQPKVISGSIDKFEENNSLLKNYVKDTNPMTMKHILVKVASTDNTFNQAEITEEESDKLGTVVKRLAMGKKSMNSFTKVAIDESEDGSAANGGNLGIVDEYTSFVDEFKYGVYSSLAYNAKHDINQEKAKVGFDGIVDALDLESKEFEADGLYGTIGEIEVEDAYTELITNKEETGKQDNSKDKEDTSLYPRNKHFNEAFNVKSAQYLKVSDPAKTAKTLGCAAEDLLIDNNGYVIDENGSPIVVVRSEFGIHFISVTHNSFNYTFEENVKFFMTDPGLEEKELEKSYWKNEIYNIGYNSQSIHTTEKNRKNEIEGRVTNYVKGGFASSVTASDEIYNVKIINNKKGTILNSESELGLAVKKTVEGYINNKIDAYNLKINTAHESVIEGYYNKIEADKAAHKDVYGK